MVNQRKPCWLKSLYLGAQEEFRDGQIYFIWPTSELFNRRLGTQKEVTIGPQVGYSSAPTTI